MTCWSKLATDKQGLHSFTECSPWALSCQKQLAPNYDLRHHQHRAFLLEQLKPFQCQANGRQSLWIEMFQVRQRQVNQRHVLTAKRKPPGQVEVLGIVLAAGSFFEQLFEEVLGLRYGPNLVI